MLRDPQEVHGVPAGPDVRHRAEVVGERRVVPAARLRVAQRLERQEREAAPQARSRRATRGRSRSRTAPRAPAASRLRPRAAARLVDRRPRRPDHRWEMPRHFTPDEANAELQRDPPARRGARLRTVESSKRLQAKRVELAAKIAGNGGGIDSQAIAELEEAEQRERIEIARCVNAIHGRGAIVKDVDDGSRRLSRAARRRGDPALLAARRGRGCTLARAGRRVRRTQAARSRIGPSNDVMAQTRDRGRGGASRASFSRSSWTRRSAGASSRPRQ